MSVRFAYINKLYTSWRGRELHDIPLPGDESEVLQMHIRRVLERDEWYNRDELAVYVCTRFRLYHGSQWCMDETCPHCVAAWESGVDSTFGSW